MDWQKIDKLKSQSNDLKQQGRYQAALELRLEVQRLLRELGSPPNEMALNLNYMAILAAHAGNLDQAERAARECLAVFRPVRSPGKGGYLKLCDRCPDEKLGTYYEVLAWVLAERRQFEEAQASAECSLDYFMRSGLHEDGDDFIRGRKCILLRIRNRDTLPYFQSYPAQS